MAYTRSDKVAFSLPYKAQSNTTVYDRSSFGSITNTRSGSNVPGYRTLIRDGLPASSAYSCDKTSLVRVSDGSSKLVFKDLAGVPNFTTQTFNGQLFSDILGKNVVPVGHLGVSQNKAMAIALSKCYSALREEMSHLNGSTVVLELRETIRSLKSPALTLRKKTSEYLEDLKRASKGLPSKPSRRRTAWLDVVSSTYLEYAFGLKPLISDTESIAEAIARFESESTDHPLLRSRFRTRGSDEASRIDNYSEQSAQGLYLKFKPQVVTKTSVRSQYTVGLAGDLRADFGTNTRLRELLGLDLQNFVPGVYEVLPWSWLLDYFTNVGSVIEAGCTFTGRVSWCVHSLSTVTTQLYSAPFSSASLPGFFRTVSLEAGHGGRFDVKRTTLVRSIVPSLPLPPLYLRNPFGEGVKIANMGSVLYQQSKSLWRP